jgi:DNA invertase Pin-like site-specific DNA recombinase
LYPNFNDANQKFYTKFVNPEPSKKKKKKRKSRAEQRKIYQELLDSGEVKNQAEIARKFNVSRAWVTKVLNIL